MDMNESVVVRWLLIALLAMIGFMWTTMATRVTELERFAARGDRCTAERCSVIENRLDFANVQINDLEERLRRIEREHADFRKNERVSP